MYYTELGHLYVIIIFFFLYTFGFPGNQYNYHICSFAQFLIFLSAIISTLTNKAVKFLSIEIYQFITLKGQWKRHSHGYSSSFCLNLNMCFSSMFYCYHLRSPSHHNHGNFLFSAQLVPWYLGNSFFFLLLVYSLVWFRHPRNFPNRHTGAILETFSVQDVIDFHL